jgi:ABC-type maltose transport system permease subunit
MKRIYHFRDKIRCKIILKIIIKEQDMKFWIGFFCLILVYTALYLFSLYMVQSFLDSINES